MNGVHNPPILEFLGLSSFVNTEWGGNNFSDMALILRVQWKVMWLNPNEYCVNVSTIRFKVWYPFVNYRRFPDDCPVGSNACMFELLKLKWKCKSH